MERIIGLKFQPLDCHQVMCTSMIVCTDHGIEQICSILYTPNNAVHLHFMDVDKQINHTNCGLYAITYAIDLCRAIDEDVCYRKYDAVLMHQHLSK